MKKRVRKMGCGKYSEKQWQDFINSETVPPILKEMNLHRHKCLSCEIAIRDLEGEMIITSLASFFTPQD